MGKTLLEDFQYKISCGLTNWLLPRICCYCGKDLVHVNVETLTDLKFLDEKAPESTQNIIANKATTKMIEEKKQREHLLQLNQILAKQVMEMSKIVAGIYDFVFILHLA